MRTGLLALSLLAAAVAAVPATAGAGAAAPDRARVTVDVQQAAGDPGVLYVGGPLKVVVHDARRGGDAIRVCLEPAPIDRPSCRAGRAGAVVDAGAPSAAGRTRLRVELPGGRTLERTLRILANEDARRFVKPRFVGRPAAIYTPRAGGRAGDFAMLVRLDRALPANGMQRPAILVAPSLLAGEVLADDQQLFGGLTPGRFGRRSRHCYIAEGQQPRPLATPRDGARWSVGLHRLGRVSVVASATIRRSAVRDVQRRIRLVARALGC